MKAIKIYLIVVTILLLGAIGFGVYIWYTIQSLNTDGVQPTQVENTPKETSVSGETKQTEPTQEGITITKDSLTPTQQKLVETLGFSQDSLTITPTMLSCAEESVGKERLAEITNGAAPTPLESMKLLPCFKK